LEEPGQYDRFTRVNCQQKHEDKCIDVIFGWKKKDGKEVSEIQALRYDKKVWTESSARSHCKSRGGSFEPASEESKGKGDLKMQWYEIKSKIDISEIWLYDEIGIWGVGAKEFIAELNAIKSPKIDMHINSPGGEVFDGAAIYNAVKRHPASVTSYIDGIAASISSVIALAGEKVIMAGNALYMMHNPSGLVIGTSEDMRKLADVLDKIRDTMIGAYIGKSKKTEEEVIALLNAETWLDAEEAKAAGFVDEIGDEMDMAACAKFIPAMAKAGFKHIPKQITAMKEIPEQKDLEHALRDVGCSVKFRKTLLAKGYTAALRDVGQVEEPQKATEPLRDVEKPKPARKDRVSDLLIRAEMIAPSTI
jgi:ATP-dependent protease ClpP protease subunit